MTTAKPKNRIQAKDLPDLIGVEGIESAPNSFSAKMDISSGHLAPNGYLHAGSVVTLADSCAGHGCMANLPQGARGFTTIELKSNHLGTAREGTLECTAKTRHSGRTTQVWDAEVRHRESDKLIAIFRCTQMILY